MALLTTQFCGLTFPHPVMPAAGPNVLDAAHCRRAVEGGASAVVVKTVSTRPAKVPKPCMMRYKKNGILNCELWSELPAEKYIESEYQKAHVEGLPLIAGVGYTADQLAELGPKIVATGYVDALEFSLHYTGKDIEQLVLAARSLRQSVAVPIFAKLSPAMQDIGSVARALEPYVNGFVAINSVGAALHFNAENPTPVLGAKNGFGWLSGEPVQPIALRCVAEIAMNVSKPVIGVGGIFTGKDALAFLMAGAKAVQICSAAILNGPTIYGKVARELNDLLDAQGYASVEECYNAYSTAAKRSDTIDYEGHPPSINHEKCVQCGLCVRSCCPGALTLRENELLQCDEKLCVRCGLCLDTCPRNALE
jgi:dihydroorotate dehydrogenase (NAD+) catalytic subunit